MATKRDYARLFDLTGRKAIVTGGSRGIGRALTEALAAHGADVAIVVRSSIGLAEELAAELNQGGGDSFAIQADVSVPTDVERMAAAVEARWAGPTSSSTTPASFCRATPRITASTPGVRP